MLSCRTWWALLGVELCKLLFVLCFCRGEKTRLWKFKSIICQILSIGTPQIIKTQGKIFLQNFSLTFFIIDVSALRFYFNRGLFWKPGTQKMWMEIQQRGARRPVGFGKRSRPHRHDEAATQSSVGSSILQLRTLTLKCVAKNKSKKYVSIPSNKF